jgi:G:T-mismatch repair DNA endonuclease (very short patch repair protein)
VAYISKIRDDVIHAANGMEVHLPRVPNLKVHGYSPKTQDVFEYLGCYWHGCPCMQNRHKPIGSTKEILLSRYEETTARLNEIENAGYKVVSMWGCVLKN